MKRLLLVLLPISLFVFSCEEEVEEDTTPPTVSISSHSSGQSVNEITTITVTTQDNEGISKVEFFIDDLLVLTDSESPYEYDWNTTQYINWTEHIVKVISYDNSDNLTESQPIMLIVNNFTSTPSGGNITSVTYTLTEMTVVWKECSDGDFKDYKVLYSDTEIGDKYTLETFTDKSTTSYMITEFDPLIENWFWVQVTDTLGLFSIGTGMTNDIDSPPTSPVLYPITYNDGFQISWSQNDDDDFVSYKLFESPSEDMSNQTLVYETDDITETTFIKTVQNFRYYQTIVEDIWGLQSTSNIEVGDYEVELWGNYYSVLYSTSLNFSESQLTGSIPPEIGNLINLTGISFIYNQLTGSIPPEIGNLNNLTILRLSSNQLSGSIPPEIGNLTNLIYLGCHSNQLTGSIPSEIWNLTNLRRLDLSLNQLTGEIPSEIGYLTNLTELNLGDNQLTGEIPESICDLNIDWDNTFDISQNQLCPPYPSCIEDYVGEQDTSNCD